MGDTKGFMKYRRQDLTKEPAETRKKHWKEFIRYLSDEELKKQGARCMDCGVPFCHWACPIGNVIPDWNDLVYHGRWKEAVERLCQTNSFAEITGRVCPALCENSCVMAINQPATAIRNIEISIIEKAYERGWIQPRIPKKRSGKTIAVVGSGPAGLACADQLNKKGHSVTVYEKNEDVGGLLTFGIPDFKLEKWVVKRRVDLMREAGIVFKTGVCVGVDVKVKYLQKEHDAVVLAGGAGQPRDLEIPGRKLSGVHQAIEYLIQQNRVNRGQKIRPEERITAEGKNVIVLGGGDTGSDCVGTANRQGAKSVKQFELLDRPPEQRSCENPWPQWANIYRRSTSHEEGVEQDYGIMTKFLTGEGGHIRKLHAVRLEFGLKDPQTGCCAMKEIRNSVFEENCDLLLLAMGFLGPDKKGMLQELGVKLDQRGNVKTNEKYMTSFEGIFAAGDMRRGQSLVVWAIDEGRLAAQGVCQWLAGRACVKKS